MTVEIRSGALAAISEFSKDLDRDAELAARFAADPVGVLGERDIDIAFPEGSGYQSLSDVLGNLDVESRVAALRSIGVFIDNSGPRATQDAPDLIVLVITNANAVVNANAGANSNAGVNSEVNANATANSNVNTDGVGMQTHTFAHRVSVFDGYHESEVAERLAGMRLTQPRQLALLKRAALDGEQLSIAEGAELRRSSYTFHGHTFEVDSRVTPDEVEIVDVRLVSA
jgi:hypothetical protein